jgi:uncharacterized protein YbcI
MNKPSDFDEKGEAVAHVANDFLKQNFACSPQSVKVLMDHEMVVVRVNKFLSPAEIKMALEKGDMRLLHEMYTRLFERLKTCMVAKIEQTTLKEVISSQVNVSLESELCVMNFFLSATLERKIPGSASLMPSRKEK